MDSWGLDPRIWVRGMSVSKADKSARRPSWACRPTCFAQDLWGHPARWFCGVTSPGILLESNFGDAYLSRSRSENGVIRSYCALGASLPKPLGHPALCATHEKGRTPPANIHHCSSVAPSTPEM